MTYQDRIYNQLISDGLPDTLAKLMVAQASFETAYNGVPFNSPVFRADNNAFGYKWVGQSTASGAGTMSPEGDYYAHYDNVEQSAHEMALWIYRRQKDGTFPGDLRTITDPYQYAQYLENARYFTAGFTTYYNGLSYWWQMVLQLPLSTKTIGVGMLFIIGAAFIIHYRKRLFSNKNRSILQP